LSTPATTITQACSDPALFGRWFRDPSTWRAWFGFLRALFGLDMDDRDRALFNECTGRDAPATGGYKEAWLVVGRRGGKSIVLALIAVFLACFVDWAPFLAPGERGTIVVIATDRKQARVIFRYLRAMLTRVPLLAPLVTRETAEAIDLDNGVTIEIQTASFRTTRGYTLIAALLDELAFWSSEGSSNPDTEIVGAIRPAMATVPGAVLLCASSPYARRGALWEAYRRHYGKPASPVLVWKAPTRTMNPTVPQSVVDEAMLTDPSHATAEYLAEFRVDVESFVSREVVDAAVVGGRYELPRIEGVSYVGFCDPSGGSNDSMTLAIAHGERGTDRIVLDVVREVRPPFSPDDTVRDFAELLLAYDLRQVAGDRYGGMWPAERFRVHGIEYQVAGKPKSDIYRDLLPILNSGRAELLDVPRLASQLCALERRTARGGKDSIDHAPNGRDDVINSAAGAIVMAAGAAQFVMVAPIVVTGPYPDMFSAAGGDAYNAVNGIPYGDGGADALLPYERGWW
jgi:hypothetical protein